jgi:hypothetical protein
MVSGWVLIQAITPKIPPSAAIDNYPQQSVEQPPDIPDEMVEPTVPTDQSDPSETASQTTGMPPDVLTSNVANSNFSLPPSVGIYVQGGAIGTGGTSSTSGKETAGLKKSIGKIFNTTIESNQLGVMIDVSASAHPYLISMVGELDKFDNAIIFLVFGCGMLDNVKESQVRIRDFSSTRLDPKLDAPNKRTTLQQIALAETKSPDIAKMFKNLRTRNNVYYVYGGDLGATQYAFEALLKKNVDTIYWFADFEDRISDNWQKKILQDIKNKQVRVFVHNFSGRATGQGMNFAKQLANDTNGKVIITTPPKTN